MTETGIKMLQGLDCLKRDFIGQVEVAMDYAETLPEAERRELKARLAVECRLCADQTREMIGKLLPVMSAKVFVLKINNPGELCRN